MKWEVEELLEMVEMAEECAMSELAAFGCIGAERGMYRQTPEENSVLWGAFFECDEYMPFELY